MTQRPISPKPPPRAGRLEPVLRASTVDMITERIREAIFSGALPPGAPLGEAEMSQQLGVSRGPLREGMQRLVQEGLLTTVRRRGLGVVTMSHDEVADVYQMRAAVERAAVRQLLRADQRHVKHTVKQLTAFVKRMSRATAKGSAVQLGDAYTEFHTALVDAAGSRRLSRSIRTLMVESRVCTFSIHDSLEVRASLAEEHELLTSALSDRDEARVAALLDQHMASAVDWLTAPPRRVEEVETFASPTPDSPQPLDRLELPENV